LEATAEPAASSNRIDAIGPIQCRVLAEGANPTANASRDA